jgi:hypothetical protein
MLHRFWPLPALLAWLLAWGLCLTLRASHAPLWAMLTLPSLLGVVMGLWPALAATRWRTVFVAGGFPLSVLALGLTQGSVILGQPSGSSPGDATSAWVWLIPLALLLLAYPVRAWRDAPLFPTPPGALADLPRHVTLPAGAAVLDAGCGLGDGLRALHQAFPQAACHGTEWSWPLALACRLRCPWAQVRRGDLWAQDWSGFALVYLFQRPESMPQALAKARAQMRPGSWLVSLEFEAHDDQGRAPKASHRLTLDGGRPVWIYRM